MKVISKSIVDKRICLEKTHHSDSVVEESLSEDIYKDKVVYMDFLNQLY